MTNIAYIFPGQGAQYTGMGKDFYAQSPQARAIFEQADQILGFELSQLIFSGPIEQLTQTVNCQAAIFTASIAYLNTLQAKNLPLTITRTAGLSLGEYSALVASGALSFPEGLKLVRARAEFMEEAARLNPGGMLCLIGISIENARQICNQTQAEIANLNCPGQIVVSGTPEALEQTKEKAREQNVKRVIPLQVSGAFHSSLMTPAAQKLALFLENIHIQSPQIPIVSNVTAQEESLPQKIKDNLAKQVVMPTRWEDTIKFISAQGTKTFIEIGPGKVLAGLLRKIDPQLKVYSIETMEDIEKFALVF
ncbi:MAG: ACP S-malonyltransferase [Candidatus Omnitrophota bacterium]